MEFMAKEIMSTDSFKGATVICRGPAPFLFVEDESDAMHKFIAVFTDISLIDPFITYVGAKDSSTMKVEDPDRFFMKVKIQSEKLGWVVTIALNPTIAEDGEFSYSIIEPIDPKDMAVA